MNLTSALRDTLLLRAKTSLHPTVSAWTSPQIVHKELVCEIKQACLYLTENDFGVQFHQSCPVPGAAPKDYLHKFLKLPGKACAIVGIRFRGLDPNFPFVELAAYNFPLEDEALRKELLSAVTERFRVFTPQWLRVRLSSHRSHGWLSHLEHLQDQRYLAGHLQTLQRQKIELPRYGELRVEPCVNDKAFWFRYLEAYDAFVAARPELRHEVQATTLESFDLCQKEGLICQFWRGDQWVGLVAAAPDREWGIVGYCMYEEILMPEFWGQGYGSAVQRHFLERLKPVDNALIYGTIYAQNHPSLATAKRNGRIDIGGYTFLRLPADR